MYDGTKGDRCWVRFKYKKIREVFFELDVGDKCRAGPRFGREIVFRYFLQYVKSQPVIT